MNREPASPGTNHVQRIRAFVAVHLPIPVIERVTQVQTQLRGRAREAGLKVGWVSAAQLHVTLKFLGEIVEESRWAIRDRLQDRLAGRAAFEVAVRGVGAFPDRARPKVIWVGIEEAAPLVALAGEVESWLSELGFAKETRPFHPHLTLGRVKAGAADILAGLEAQSFGTAEVSEVTLYQSVLRPQGAEYKPLARVALTTNAPERSQAPWTEPTEADDADERDR
jgi:2'-5' RNA ligase